MQAPPSDNLFVQDLPEGTDENTLKTVFSCYGSVVQGKVIAGNKGFVRYSSMEEAQWVVENVNGNIPEGFSTPVQVKFANPPGGGKGGGKWQQNNSAPYPGGGAIQQWQPQGKAAGGKGKDGGGKGGKGNYAMKDFVKMLSMSGNLPGGKWTNDENCIFVGGLAQDCTDEDLYQIFSPFGAIASKGVRAMKNKETGQCTGFGFVNFIDPAATPLAIMTLNNQQLPDGQMLRVSIKGPAKEKGQGKGMGGDLS